MADTEFLKRRIAELTDQGKIIEAGWVGFRLQAIDPEAGKVQLEFGREAFFAGAQHLLASIMTVLDDGEEATERDLKRMDLISQELEIFITDYAKRHGLQEGSTH